MAVEAAGLQIGGRRPLAFVGVLAVLVGGVLAMNAGVLPGSSRPQEGVSPAAYRVAYRYKHGAVRRRAPRASGQAPPQPLSGLVPRADTESGDEPKDLPLPVGYSIDSLFATAPPDGGAKKAPRAGERGTKEVRHPGRAQKRSKRAPARRRQSKVRPPRERKPVGAKSDAARDEATSGNDSPRGRDSPAPAPAPAPSRPPHLRLRGSDLDGPAAAQLRHLRGTTRRWRPGGTPYPPGVDLNTTHAPQCHREPPAGAARGRLTCAQGRHGPLCAPCLVDCSIFGRCNDTSLGSGKCAQAPVRTRPAFRAGGVEGGAAAAALHGEVGALLDLGFEGSPLPLAARPGDLVVSSIFRTKEDPQRKRRIHCAGGPECMDYMRPLLDSAARHNLSVLILHDGLGSDLISRVQRRPQVRFYAVRVGDFTVNDERFRALSRFLDAYAGALGRVFMTDMHDVALEGDPFRLVFGDQYRIYVGSEPNRLADANDYIFRRFTECNLGVPDQNTVLFNSGILGGEASRVRDFSSAFVSLLSFPGNEGANCNMPAFNSVIQHCYRPHEVFHQYPLHSAFAGEEDVRVSPRPFFIRHK